MAAFETSFKSWQKFRTFDLLMHVWPYTDVFMREKKLGLSVNNVKNQCKSTRPYNLLKCDGTLVTSDYFKKLAHEIIYSWLVILLTVWETSLFFLLAHSITQCLFMTVLKYIG